MRSIVHAIFDVTSVWSVVARGVIWFIIAAVIIISTDTPRPEMAGMRIKQNLGFVLMFLVLSGTLVYLLFGYSPAPSS